MVPTLTLIRLTAGVLLALFIVIIFGFTPTVSSRTAVLEQDLDRHFVTHQSLQLDARTVSQQVRETGRLSVATSDLSFDLELVPNDIRALGYRAEEFGADGRARLIDIGPVRTFKGRARGRQGGAPLPQVGEARFTVDENRVEGLIITPTEHYFVEPARKYSKAATTADYVVYREADVATSSTGECGVTLSEQVNQRAEANNVSASALVSPPPALLQSLQVATEADNEYVLSKGGSAPAAQEILSIMNQVDGIYEMQLGLTLRVSYQSFWSSANQPYSSNNPSGLLAELSNYWNANRGSVGRDVVHMWTAKNLENATFGTAYLEALCRYTGSGRAAYGLSKGLSGVQQIAVTAHEIGHNVGATHPNQQVPPPADCNNTIMGSSVGTTPRLDFCSYSTNEIANYLETNTNCLGVSDNHLSFAVPKPINISGAVAVDDFNGDGKQDLALTAVDGVNVMLGSDNGTFLPAINYQADPSSSIALGDFDSDGKRDLVVTNPSTGKVSVLRGNGAGAFQLVASHPAGDSHGRIVVSDFDADGKQDLALVGSNDSVNVLFGTGSFGFGAPVSFPAGSAPSDIGVGDFNGDQNSDLVVSNFDSSFRGGLSLLLGTGNGGFQPPTFTLLNTTLPGMTVGDFNSDGKSDVAATITDRITNPPLKGFVEVLFGSEVDPLSHSTGSEVNMQHPFSVAFGDFNGDGNQDLAVSGIEVGLDLLLGDGNGFAASISYNDGAAGAVGDFDGDGNQDLVSFAGLLLGSSTGFQAPRKQIVQFPTSVAAADFNRDGKQDIAMTNSFAPFSIVLSGRTLKVLLGTGTGDFNGTSTVAFFDFELTDVAAGDFNNDSFPDLAVTTPSGAQFNKGLYVFLGKDSGFQAPVTFAGGSRPTAIVPADFNADGKLDLIVANDLADAGELSLMLGSDVGIFQGPTSVASVGDSPSDLAVGDFNADGKLDLVVAYESRDEVTLLFGLGAGAFLPGVNLDVGTAIPGATTRTVAVGDFNFDGKLDLAVGGIMVFLGTGTGSFRSPITFQVGGYSGLAVADFNGDGKVDIGFASGTLHPRGEEVNNGSICVLINTTGNSVISPFNDLFANARGISGSNGTITGGTVLATKEAGEANHASESNGSGGASIWYRWKAPSTGRFYFQTFSSSFASVIGVYTGSSVAALTPVVKSTSSVPEYVEFNATAGTTYQIAIDGVTGDSGRTVLTWNTGSLTNDNFEFAREIRGFSGSVNGNNTNFTVETGEPTLPGAINSGFSAWYRWTAPNTGKVIFSATPCGISKHLLGAYTENFIDILVQVAVNFDGYRDVDDPGICDNRTLRFNAVAGTSYRIQLRSISGAPFTLNWNYADPPPNDNFANALILAGVSGSIAGTNRDATKEPGEPNHAGGLGGASIWYRWTAPASGPVTFDTIGFRNQSANSFRYLTALMAVYTGSSLNALTAVVTSATDNKVSFDATAGTTYQIAIDSGPYSGGGLLPGLVPLHWGTKQVSNDDFANAQPLAAVSNFSPLLGSNASATKETGEPNHVGNAGGTSVWYRWTALTDGAANFVFNTCATCSLPAANALVAVYTGGAVNALTTIPTSLDNNHSFVASRGQTYFIAVDSQTGTGGTYEFSLVSPNISARNNDFNKAQVLSGNAGAVAGDNSGATKELNEPDHANDKGGASVWYQWTAPASGLYTFDTFGSNFDTLIGVYTGNLFSGLSTVASSDNAGVSAQSRVTFDAKLNTTYFIAVDGKSIGVEPGTGLPRSQTGFIQLSWNNLPPPLNDNFANAEVITGSAGNVSGRNTMASKEGGEPNHAGNPGGLSVWYRWQAPVSGSITFTTASSDFNTLLAVYTGNAVSALASLSSNDDVGGLTQSRVTFNALAGTVYYIAVDGSVGVPGNVTALSGNVVLSWFVKTAISNDNFLSAQELIGSAGGWADTNAGASEEPGEPDHAGDRGGRSLWYSWTAPFSGPALITTAGSDFDTLLAVYTGTTVNTLTAVASNDDSPYSDNPGAILTSSLTFTAVAGTTYKIVVDGSGGRFGNFALRWGREAKISGQVSFLGNVCGSNKRLTMILSGEDNRVVSFSGSGTYTFEHLRVGGNYSVRGVSEISDNCVPLFLERAKNMFPLAGDVLDGNFIDDGLRGGGSTSNITGRVRNAAGVGISNVAIALSGSASRTVYTDSGGLYQLPDLPVGTYQVTPSKEGAVFNPTVRSFTFTTGQSITEADYVAQDSFNISGQTRDRNGIAISGVMVTLGSAQPNSVETDSNGYYSFDAVAGGSYTLTAAKAGLSFTPESKSINGLNANQKNVDFTVTQTQTLTVASVNPNSGVNITITPNDNLSQGNGATQFTRTYNLNTKVTLTAAVTAGNSTFQKWQKDGSDYSTSVSTDLTLDADHTMTAVYLTTATQTPTGQNVTVQLNGVTVTYTGVSAAGTTSIVPINPAAAGQLPDGYQLTGNSIAFDISTTATVQPPISVCLIVPSITDATEFSQLRLLHNENGALVDRTSSQDFAAKMICASVSSLSPFVLVSTTGQQLQLLLEESVLPGTQVAALDSLLFMRDPFPVLNPSPLSGADKNTRVLVFVRGVQLAPGETAAAVVVHLVDAQGMSYDIAAESMFSLSSFDFGQLTFRLPDTLAPGTCSIEVRAHGHFSNLGTIRIRM